MKENWKTKLSRELNLVEENQDWGICNADSKRIDEFIRFYRLNEKIDDWENEELAELILQSFEELAEGESLTQSDITKLQDFIVKHSDEFPNTLNYWRSLKGDHWNLKEVKNETYS